MVMTNFFPVPDGLVHTANSWGATQTFAAITATTVDASTDFTIGTTVITDDTITFGAAASVLTTAGNLTLHAAAGADVLIGDDVTLFVVDGGTGTVGFGASAPAATRAQAWTRFPAIAFTGDGSNTFSRFEFSWDAVVTISSGDIAVLSNVKIVRPGEAVSGVAIDIAASLWLSEPPSVGTLRYALYVDEGDSRFNGNVIIGTDAKGIDFTANTDDEGAAGAVVSELLDDYEEGTWTPAMAFSSSVGDANVTSAVGTYTKVGNLVTFSCRMRLHESSASGNFSITGLPFESGDLSAGFYGGGAYVADGIGIEGLSWWLGSSSTVLALYHTPSGSFANITHAEIGTSNTDFTFTGLYYSEN